MIDWQAYDERTRRIAANAAEVGASMERQSAMLSKAADHLDDAARGMRQIAWLAATGGTVIIAVATAGLLSSMGIIPGGLGAIAAGGTCAP